MFATMLLIALGAQFLAFRFGAAAAIMEIILGMVLANLMGWQASSFPWLVFLTSLAGVLLTFLAGTEIDEQSLKQNWKRSLVIGIASFSLTFVTTAYLCYQYLGWNAEAALLAGTALSETSIAIVYVVLVEGGRSRTPLGSMILCACFFTNLIATIALTVIFTQPSIELALLAIGLALTVWLAPKLLASVSHWFRDRSGDVVLKMTLAVLAGLMVLSAWAGVAAVLSAYVIGMALARFMRERREEAVKMKLIVTGFLSSFFFIAAGSSVRADALVAGFFVVLLLVALRLGSKWLSVSLACKALQGRDTAYTALLMSTSLTFGMVFCQIGLDRGFISSDQFSILVAVLIICAIIPTILAEKYFDPWGAKNELG